MKPVKGVFAERPPTHAVLQSISAKLENRKVVEWVEGEPKGSFWHGVDLSSASQIPIVTYRCAACGYLEFYARGKELGLIP